MPTVNILASGTTEAASSDIVIASGGSATVLVVDANGPMVDPNVALDVQMKASNGEYFNIGVLNRDNLFCQQIAAPGTYRVFRHGCQFAIGVESSS
jgi:hypothetical protein